MPNVSRFDDDERSMNPGYYLDEELRPVYTQSDGYYSTLEVPYHRTESYRIGKTDRMGRVEGLVNLHDGEEVTKLKRPSKGDSPYKNTTIYNFCVVQNETLANMDGYMCENITHYMIEGPPDVDVRPGTYTWKDVNGSTDVEIASAGGERYGFVIRPRNGQQYYIAPDLRQKGHYHAITKTGWELLREYKYGYIGLEFWGLWPGSTVEGYSKIELKRKPEPAPKPPTLPNAPLLPTPVVPPTPPTPVVPVTSPASATPATKALSSNSRLSKEPSESGLSTAVIGLIICLSSAALGAAVFVAWRHWSKKQAKIK